MQKVFNDEPETTPISLPPPPPSLLSPPWPFSPVVPVEFGKRTVRWKWNATLQHGQTRTGVTGWCPLRAKIRGCCPNFSTTRLHFLCTISQVWVRTVSGEIGRELADASWPNLSAYRRARFVVWSKERRIKSWQHSNSKERESWGEGDREGGVKMNETHEWNCFRFFFHGCSTHAVCLSLSSFTFWSSFSKSFFFIFFLFSFFFNASIIFYKIDLLTRVQNGAAFFSRFFSQRFQNDLELKLDINGFRCTSNSIRYSIFIQLFDNQKSL